MPIPRLARRGTLIVWATATLLLQGSACPLLDPCYDKADAARAIDGTWDLVAVNGQSVPAPGILLPSGTDRLKGGVLRFQTTHTDVHGSCEEASDPGLGLSNEGQVVATYELVNSGGQSMPAKSYAGTFYASPDGSVRLHSAGQVVAGQRSGDEFTVAPRIPEFGSFVLKFQRRRP